MKYQQMFDNIEEELHAVADDDIDREADEFKQGVTMAKDAFTQAVEAGWNPMVDPLPEVPDHMPMPMQEGFNAFGLNVKTELGVPI